MLALQQSAGNRAVNHLLRSGASGESLTARVQSTLNGPGQVLAPATRAAMELHFSQRFIHGNISPARHSIAPTGAALAVRRAADPAEEQAEGIADGLPSVASAGGMLSESRCDFSQVRVHTDARADASARALNARAYAVGPDIVFRAGQYAPHTVDGRSLLAHELAHVVQQEQGGTPIIQRWTWAGVKEVAYDELISLVRKERDLFLNSLRSQVGRLPESARAAANTLIDICAEALGVVITVVMAVLGIVVGLGEGIVGIIQSLIALVQGVMKLLVLFVVGFFDKGEAFDHYANEIIAAVKGMPAALQALVDDWLERFKKAPPERQSLMIGELTGQIEALILTWGVAATKAAQLPKHTVQVAVPVVRGEEMALATAGVQVAVAPQFAGAGLGGALLMEAKGKGEAGSKAPEGQKETAGRKGKSHEEHRADWLGKARQWFRNNDVTSTGRRDEFTGKLIYENQSRGYAHRYYTVDEWHGQIEVFDNNKQHIGALVIDSGVNLPAVPNRKIKF